MSKWMRGFARGVLTAGALACLAHGAGAQLDEKLEALDAAMSEIYDGNPVSLAECIEIALMGSSTLGSQEEDLDSANWDVRSAWAQWLPDLSINGSWSKSKRTDFDDPQSSFVLEEIIFADSAGDPLPLTVNGEQAFSFSQVPAGTADTEINSTNKQGSANTNWTVFSGFSRFAAVSRAKLDREATESSLGYQRTLVVEQVSNAYLDYVRAILKVGVAEDAEDLATRELEKSETYFELGISTRSDVLQQKVQLQRNRLETVQARNEKRNTFASLVHLMNIPGASEFDVDIDVPVGDSMTIPELDTLLESARSGRLDYYASSLNVDARGKAVTEARAGFYPSVSVFASYSLSENTTPFRFGAAKSDAVSWGIQGQWNIFDRFQTKSQSRRAVASRRKAEYDHRQAGLDLEKEIVQLRNNLIESSESFAVATQTVEQSQEELRLAQERFKVGAGTSLDVINAQVGLAQARRDVVDARTNYAKFWQQLERASGGMGR